MNNDYTAIWRDRKDEIIKFDRTLLKECGAKDDIVDMLVEIGLPKAIAPGFNFRIYQSSRMKEEGVGYIVIGFIGSGENICIEVKSGKIVINDYEKEKKILVNSTLPQLYESLKYYSEFIDEICEKKGRFAFVNKEFSEKEIEELGRKIEQTEFWEEELNSLL